MSVMACYVVGAGGLGRETYDAALAAGLTVTAFIDEGREGEHVRGLPVIGVESAEPEGHFTLGIADPQARERLAELLVTRGLEPQNIVHPRAVIGPDTRAGEGLVVLAGAHISSSIDIGAHCNVQYNATVGHNAVVLQGLRIGAGAMVGAGAVVTRDVRPGDVVVGSPARNLDR
jgi:acyl-[acyl carrier protein]--UDP-N-acetylglucosamine O-acyltransferase